MSLIFSIAGGIVVAVIALGAIVLLAVFLAAKYQGWKEHRQYLESIKRQQQLEERKNQLKEKWKNAIMANVVNYLEKKGQYTGYPLDLMEMDIVIARLGELKAEQKNYAELQKIIKENTP